VYVDECGLDESIHREYARSLIGRKVLDDISGNRAARTSIIAGFNQQNTLAPWHFQGYCNTDVILTWVKNELIPLLKTGMTVVWDNVAFHKSSQIKTLIENVGCKTCFVDAFGIVTIVFLLQLNRVVLRKRGHCHGAESPCTYWTISIEPESRIN
jgi:hypothetical protein